MYWLILNSVRHSSVLLLSEQDRKFHQNETLLATKLNGGDLRNQDNRRNKGDRRNTGNPGNKGNQKINGNYSSHKYMWVSM
jgi:hypothetical protein